MAFAAAPEYDVFPTLERPLDPYEAVAVATGHTRALVADVRPDAVAHDILTLAPALAAELEGVAVATVVPHVDPRMAPGLPPYSLGARAPRTALGRRLWQSADPVLQRGVARGREDLNTVRGELGLPAQPHGHGAISRSLCLIGTFPQLEPPRAWPPGVHVVGPLLWEPPADEVALPPGDAPLVLVAPSTSQDPGHALLRAALHGLAGEPVRVLATSNRRAPGRALAMGPDARLVDWLSYARTMPRCAAVVCHAGHGTVARALACGAPVIGCPAGGDMAENAARVAWAGCGISLPRRLVTPRGVRLAVRKVLAEPGFGHGAARLRGWAERNDGSAIAAEALEGLAEAPTGAPTWADLKLRGWESNPQPLD